MAEVSYQIENTAALLKGAVYLWKDHFAEAHPNWDKEFVPEIPSYVNCEHKGELVIVTARQDGKIIGYLLFIVRANPHYKALSAFDDNFYVAPEARRGLVGYRLLKFGIEVLRKLGVSDWHLTAPEGKNYDALFRRLGLKRAYTVWRGSSTWARQ